LYAFTGSKVQGCILGPGLDLEFVFTKIASASSGLIQNLESNWQLFGEWAFLTKTSGLLCS
jgi:hypothetical protein